MTDETPAITAAEMQATREYLGLSTKWISEQLVMNERRLTRMETGQERSIPLAVAKLLDEVYEDARETVGAHPACRVCHVLSVGRACRCLRAESGDERRRIVA